MSEEVFGQLISPWRIQQAALGVLKEWMPTYLAAVERQEGYELGRLGRPEVPLGYYPAVDFETSGPGAEAPAMPPMVIVTVKPHGAPEMIAIGYVQEYRMGVACVTVGATEEEALLLASGFGAASMLFCQLGDLAGLAERTVMIAAPEIELVSHEPAERRLMRSVVEYSVYVPNIVLQAGPGNNTIAESTEIVAPEVKPESPPEVKTTKLIVDVEAEEY